MKKLNQMMPKPKEDRLMLSYRSALRGINIDVEFWHSMARSWATRGPTHD